MINWFGPSSWGAPICLTTPRCDAPVGEPCARCTAMIQENDRGLVIPSIEGAPHPFHLLCFLNTVGIGHFIEKPLDPEP